MICLKALKCQIHELRNQLYFERRELGSLLSQQIHLENELKGALDGLLSQLGTLGLIIDMEWQKHKNRLASRSKVTDLSMLLSKMGSEQEGSYHSETAGEIQTTLTEERELLEDLISTYLETVNRGRKVHGRYFEGPSESDLERARQVSRRLDKSFP